MDKDKYKQKTVYLSIIWIVTFFPFLLYSAVRRFKIQLSGAEMHNSLDGYVVFILALVAFYYLPLLRLIQKCANRAQLNKIEKISTSLISLFTGTLILAPIAFLLMLINV